MAPLNVDAFVMDVNCRLVDFHSFRGLSSPPRPLIAPISAELGAAQSDGQLEPFSDNNFFGLIRLTMKKGNYFMLMSS